MMNHRKDCRKNRRWGRAFNSKEECSRLGSPLRLLVLSCHNCRSNDFRVKRLCMAPCVRRGSFSRNLTNSEAFCEIILSVIKNILLWILELQLCDLYEIATGVVQYCDGRTRTRELSWLHGKLHTELLQSFILFLDIIHKE